LVTFMCLTRMHERYLYPYFVFAGLLGVTGRSGILYWLLSALFFANQLLVYLYQKDATAGPVWLWSCISIAGVLALVGALLLYWRTASGREEFPASAALDEDDARWQESLTAARTTAEARAPEPRVAGAAEADSETSTGPRWRWQEIVFLLVLTGITLG